jgi:hypothetical protein
MQGIAVLAQSNRVSRMLKLLKDDFMTGLFCMVSAGCQLLANRGGCQYQRVDNSGQRAQGTGWKPMLASMAIVLAVLVTLNLIGLTIAAYFLLRRK